MTDKSNHVIEAMSPPGLYPLAHNNAAVASSEKEQSGSNDWRLDA